MAVPMLGLNYSFVHKRTAKPLDQMQLLDLSITESSSLFGMGLGAGAQEPSLGVLRDQNLTHCLPWASHSKPSACWSSGCVRTRTNLCSGDLVTADAQR